MHLHAFFIINYVFIRGYCYLCYNINYFIKNKITLNPHENCVF